MVPIVYGLVGVLVSTVILIATGRWRSVMVVFCIRRRQMTIDRLGLAVHDPDDVDRVDRILTSFSGGFNHMMTAPSIAACDRYCNDLPVRYRPFAREGAAMGHTPRHLMRYDPARFEREIVAAQPNYRYLAYVGLGFFSGMRGHSPAELMHRTRGLDNLLGQLCYDGFGFKVGFFDYLGEPASVKRFDAFTGYARNVAFQGLGRAFRFLFMNDDDRLLANLDRLGTDAGDVAGGLGLASAFIHTDRLEAAWTLGRRLPDRWHDAFHLGLCFGLEARAVCDRPLFEEDLERCEPEVRSAIWSSIEACRFVESQIRTDGQPDGYRRWREGVTRWMSEHIEYPLQAMRQSTHGETREASQQLL